MDLPSTSKQRQPWQPKKFITPYLIKESSINNSRNKNVSCKYFIHFGLKFGFVMGRKIGMKTGIHIKIVREKGMIIVC